MLFPDFWLGPVRDERAAFLHATRAVALQMGFVEAPPSLSIVEGRADGWFVVQVVVGERKFVVRVAEEGAWAEVIATVALEASLAA